MYYISPFQIFLFLHLFILRVLQRGAPTPQSMTVGSIAEQTALWFNCGTDSGCAHERRATRAGTAVQNEPPPRVSSLLATNPNQRTSLNK